MLVSCLGAVIEAKNFEHRALTGRNSCVYSATSLLTSIRRGDGKETQQGKTGFILNNNPSSSRRTA